jgi:hypothetical protein
MTDLDRVVAKLRLRLVTQELKEITDILTEPDPKPPTPPMKRRRVL